MNSIDAIISFDEIRGSFSDYVRAVGSIPDGDLFPVLGWLSWAVDNDPEILDYVGRYTLDALTSIIWG